MNYYKAVICSFAIVLSCVAAQQCKGGVECILLEECRGLYSQLQKGNTPQLTRLLRSIHCGFDNMLPKVCCPHEFQSGAPQDITTRIEPTTSNIDLLPSTEVCGIQNSDRIVGGTITEPDEHPWMALLRYDKPRGWGFYCGGVLISSRYVLTAAHCVKGEDLPSNWKLSQVRLGEWNTSSSKDCVDNSCSPAPLNIDIEEAIAHNNFYANDENQYNDIALLRLASDVPFSNFVKPICLPISDALKRSTFDGYDMEVAGWGKTESRSESDVKLKVRVPVVNSNECLRVYNRVNRQIINKQICAGGLAGRDSCRGDSGGSLMGQSASNWFAVGVVSFGPTPCGTQGWPGVYTRVGAYVDWIISKLRP